ncbi:MAG: hypothetical protein K2K10_08060, partial [Acetatifactor sp.]|nr:hypothetical protein [Acetatifactor sp.]
MRKYRIVALLLVAAMLMGTCGCGRKKQVKLTVWGSEASQEMLREMADEFIQLHAKEAEIEIVLRVEDEDTV